MADQQLKDLTATTTPADTDILYTVVDPAVTPLDRKITWTTIKAFFKTYFDTLYAPVLTSDENYVTNAEKTVIGNTSGTNTGDNATNSQYSGLASSKQDHTIALDNVSGVNSGDETATRIGALIGGAGDATPNDTDFVATSLTAGGILKKITWTNVKAFLANYFATLGTVQTFTNVKKFTKDTLTVLGTGAGFNNITTENTSGTSYNNTIPAKDGIFAMVADVLPLAGGTMTGKVTVAGKDEVGKTYTPATGSQTVALDCAVNNVHVVVGHADGTAITFTIANCTNSQPFIVSILQGGTTVSTITSWFATIRWAGGTAPTLTATINKRDTFGFIRTGTDTYDGFVIGQNC